MPPPTSGRARPLSPHLQIYRPMLSTAMSIFHRITGTALAFGMLVLVGWLLAASMSDGCFALIEGFFYNWFGRLVLFGFTWALIHHALGGLRHFVWDTGRGFALNHVEWLVRANVIGSIVITLLIWVIGYGVRG
ncbi:succinate dehydrogenase, cytochrome b556 subunit [Aestuariivirga litoralis]|uniref:succinate dehydrogenase, cytochrome b556 subunit n=1 Tax=Aestuariivirga litoralis TaxID=2650924 RepID=UPI0018C5AA60|nr:succinate dehydrogenase, cytochrome b556 subunit [Aestuariivirga litoralis]MBG1230807.1 succinate dehydrogenase, cytochrome b556 subunit [Aestuariivirga litoralis]